MNINIAMLDNMMFTTKCDEIESSVEFFDYYHIQLNRTGVSGSGSVFNGW